MTHVSRRKFVKSTAAISAVTVVSPSIAFGSKANSAIRMGIIGCGGRGTGVISSMSQHSNTNIVAMADLFRDKLDAAKIRLDGKNTEKGFPEVDQLVFDQTGISEIMTGTISEGMKYGISGASQDAKIYKSDWGFDLNEVKSPIVIYHGELDKNVRIESAHYIIESLPHCTSYVLQNEGHLSLIYNHINDILKRLQ